ncbi:Pkinase-domain-containing protein, partial [Violaceomyces palustris]
MAEIPRSQSPEPQDAPPMQSPQELVQSEPESYFESKAQHDTPAAAASNSKAGTTPPPHRASSHHRTCSHSRNSSLSHSRNQSLNSNASLTIPRSSSMSRTPSHDYKETLDAKSKDMEDGSRIINQYRMTDVIGQGAYGTVHKASLVEDPQVKFAIKEFGKTRLRKNHRSNNLRKPLAKQPRGRAVPRPRGGFTTQSPMKNPDRDNQAKDAAEKLNDPLVLIRHEIAILKKLHHPNVVTLFEVLDDPSKDSLYMVFEHCP